MGISEALAKNFRKILYDLTQSRDSHLKIPLDPQAGFKGVLRVDEAA
jgi:CRISPR/Cas system CMR subunit Cmr4 (Cas7 group RAMP superfamily)